MKDAPIRRMLERYAKEGALRFHMPGHKGLMGLPGASHDLTELPDTDSLFAPSGGILEAQREAARAWRAGASFLLVNGSTSGIQAMALWSKVHGRKLVLPRDCHISAIYSCALMDISPVWAAPSWDAREQLARQFGFGPPELSSDDKYAVFATYPDYYGRCLGLPALRESFAGHDAALLVDSAHGAHFAFSPLFPPDAGEWARMWVCGAHKTIPAPTQASFLHLKNELDAPGVTRLLRGFTSTSPSYLLMEGLDSARAYMQAHAPLLEKLVHGCLRLAERLNALGGLRCWRAEDVRAMGYGHYDATRIVVDVRELGMSGWEAGAELRKLGLQAEMCDIYRVVLITSVADGPERLEGAYRAFEKLSLLGRKGKPIRGMDAVPARGEAVMTLRQAWLSRAAQIPLAESLGRAAAEPFGAYPPGIPLCMPGETVTQEIIDAALQAQALGGRFFGVREGKIFVVK